MSTPGIIVNMQRGWNQLPVGMLTGARSAFSAAIWQQQVYTPIEVTAEIDPETYIASVQMSRFDVEMFIDDRHLYSKRHAIGDTQLVEPGEKPRAVLGSSYRVMHFYLPRSLIVTVAQDAFSSCSFELIDPRGSCDESVLGIARRIEREARSGSALSRLCADALGLELVVHLLRRWSNRAGECSDLAPIRGGLAPWQLKRTQEAMLANLDADMGLEDLAAIAGCSPTHFSRAFKQSTGIAPFHWLNDQRIERAKELLADSRVSLAEIALAVGFSAQPQFTTAFGRATGTTPGAWRRERLL